MLTLMSKPGHARHSHRKWVTVPYFQCCAMASLLLLLHGTGLAENLPLMRNQNFEEVELGWGFWPPESQSKLEIDKDIFQHGQQSLRVTALRSSDRAFAISSLGQFEPDLLYRLSVHVRCDPQVSPSAISFHINVLERPGKPIKQQVHPIEVRRTAAGDWQCWSGLFAIPRDAPYGNLLLGVQYTEGRVWFDNVLIEKMGRAEDLPVDVWTNLTVGVEIGSPPLQRFVKHQEANDAVYQMSTRYNALLWTSAFTERDLRDLERCYAYAAKTAPPALRAGFDANEKLLNQTYLAYIAAFKSGKEEDRQTFSTTADGLAKALDEFATELKGELAGLRPAKSPTLLRSERAVVPRSR